MASPSWHQKLEKMLLANGFIASLDQSGGSTPKALRLYGIEVSEYKTEVAMMDTIHEMCCRIMMNPKFHGSRVIGTILFERTMDRDVDGMPSARYLWQKGIVPFLKIDKGLVEERGGVQLMKDMPELDALLDRAIAAGIFGTNMRSVIKRFNMKGIREVVKQQFDVAKCVIAKGLVPILEPEVDICAPDKDECERFLLDCLMEGLRMLPSDSRVLFKLTLPTQPNLYLPLMAHPCTVRVAALSGGYGRSEACRLLSHNAGMIAGYSRAFTEGMRVDQSEAEFTRVLDESCQAIFDASLCLDTRGMQIVRVQQQDGFIAALDQSGGSTPKALRLYGIDESMYQGEAEMMNKIHEMRTRIMTNPKFDGSRVVMAILFEDTMGRLVQGCPTAMFLWEQKRIVPILKIDEGLQEEKDGVQMMKEMPHLGHLLDRALSAGIFGTKERSVIKHFNAAGIRAIALQQFAVAKLVVAKGLVPILEPEVDIHAADKEACERLLLDCLLEGLRGLPQVCRVMFKLTPPTQPNLYLPLMAHPCTARVVALSGGYSRSEGCCLLSQNAGMSASFSRAFTEGMHAQQSEAEFTKILDDSCQAIFDASRGLPVKKMQMLRAQQQDGFIAALDQSGGSTAKALRLYGTSEAMFQSEAEMMDKMHDMRSRIITNPMFEGSRVVMFILFEATMQRHIDGLPTARFLWERKHVIPILKIDKGLQDEKDGVQLMKSMPLLDVALQSAVEHGIFGTKERSVIKHFNVEGIRAIVQQQFEVARCVMEKGLVPIMEPEVDIRATDKEACERLLLECLLEGLRQLPSDSRVMFKLTLPTQTNLYLPLMIHPCTLRVVALSGGYSRNQACSLLAKNAGMIAGFSRAFIECLHVNHTEDEFTRVLDESTQAIFAVSRSLTTHEMQMVRVQQQDGFIVPLDHSLRTAPDALWIYGVGYLAYCNELQMMLKMDELRHRIFTSPQFDGSRVIGSILFDGSLDNYIGGLPVARYLWEQKGIIPFVKIDQGLHEEREGVELMKDIPDLEMLLGRAKAAGVFGTKARSAIKHFNSHGIAAIVEQQFALARRVLAAGLVPIMEPEVAIHAADKEICERLLLDYLLKNVRLLPVGSKVMFRLTVPTQTNLYLPLVGHPGVLRVLALAGGYGREEACDSMQKNAGIIASFSGPFLEGMHCSQTDAAFSRKVDEACEHLWQSSRRLSVSDMQMVRIHEQDGFFAPLDQRGLTGSLRRYGVPEADAETMDRIHAMHSRIITNPVFDGSRIIGTILTEMAMDRTIKGMPSAKYVWEHKCIVPFLKIDKGVLEEKDGVQLMNDVPDLDSLLDRAVASGFFGTKMRSVVNHFDRKGLEAIVAQQFQVAQQVLAKGLVPILQLEVGIRSPDKDQCERNLVDLLCESLDKLAPAHQVLFKLALPSRPNLYQPLMEHPRTLRVLALSGDYLRAEACEMLSQNEGMIASFRRALSEGLHEQQSEKEFTRALDVSCEAIFQASRSHSASHMVGAVGGA